MIPLLQEQDGVVSRRQALAVGLEPHDLARLLRRRELSTLHDGVYVDHTGGPTFQQRCWGAVLLHAPAALSHETALRAHEGPGSDRHERPLHLVLAHERRLQPRSGMVLHRSLHLDERVLWRAGPPRVRYEEAALDVAADARSDFVALGELSRVIQSRRTTATRLAAALAARRRIPRRDWLRSVLADVAAGTCSVLEHGYLHRVERAHGLTCAQRDRDFDRDLAAAADGVNSRRVSWGQVFDRPCWTAGPSRWC